MEDCVVADKRKNNVAPGSKIVLILLLVQYCFDKLYIVGVA